MGIAPPLQRHVAAALERRFGWVPTARRAEAELTVRRRADGAYASAPRCGSSFLVVTTPTRDVPPYKSSLSSRHTRRYNAQVQIVLYAAGLDNVDVYHGGVRRTVGNGRVLVEVGRSIGRPVGGRFGLRFSSSPPLLLSSSSPPPPPPPPLLLLLSSPLLSLSSRFHTCSHSHIISMWHGALVRRLVRPARCWRSSLLPPPSSLLPPPTAWGCLVAELPALAQPRRLTLPDPGFGAVESWALARTLDIR